MKKTLITGGAGYKGTLLTEKILSLGHEVRVIDNLMYGAESLLGFASNPNFSLVKKDIRNLTKKDVEGFDFIYHLAGISGYPACEANPHSAQVINVDSTQNLVDLLSPEQILVYASTTSMYGKSGLEQDETAIPTPTSLYGITKLEAEKICMKRKNSVSLRFATIFGPSRRMRCDLLLNDFVFKAVRERNLVLFDSASVRTFLHIKDAINAYAMVLDRPEKFINNIFNVGDNRYNYSKQDLVKIIAKYAQFEAVQSKLDDLDRRDFVINFDKINKLDFMASISVDEGIQELIRLYSWYTPYSPYSII